MYTNIAALTVAPTPTWQTFESLLIQATRTGGKLTVEQDAIILLCTWRFNEQIRALRAEALADGDGGRAVALRHVERTIGLMRMAMPPISDAAMDLARQWQAAGVEVH